MMKFDNVALAFTRADLIDANTTFKPNHRARQIESSLQALVLRDFTRYGYGSSQLRPEQDIGLQPGSSPRMNGNR